MEKKRKRKNHELDELEREQKLAFGGIRKEEKEEKEGGNNVIIL